MVNRRRFLQATGATALTLSISQRYIQQQGTRYGQVLAHSW